MTMVTALLLAALAVTDGIFVVSASKSQAAYFFGDSSLDVGNTNWLKYANAKANFPPYGIDFIGATGRFSNGKLIADFISEHLRVPLAPAALDPKAKTTKYGINFATGSAGALDSTFYMKTLSLGQQVVYYQRARKAGRITKAGAASGLHVISIGSIDYIAFRPDGTIPIFTYIANVVDSISGAIRSLYASGARKFVIFGVFPLGCVPAVHFQQNSTTCYSLINAIARLHNQELQGALQFLRTRLPGVRIVYGNLYDWASFLNSPTGGKGFTNVYAACCGAPAPTNGGVQCGTVLKLGPLVIKTTVCKDHDKYAFWDNLHPGQKLAQLITNDLWSGGASTVSPYNVSTLANL